MSVNWETHKWETDLFRKVRRKSEMWDHTKKNAFLNLVFIWSIHLLHFLLHSFFDAIFVYGKHAQIIVIRIDELFLRWIAFILDPLMFILNEHTLPVPSNRFCGSVLIRNYPMDNVDHNIYSNLIFYRIPSNIRYASTYAFNRNI